MKTDIFVLQGLYKFGKVLGICRTWFSSKQGVEYTLSKLYVCCCLTISIFGTIITFSQRINGFWKSINITQEILEGLQCPSELLFISSCFIISLTKSNDWKDLFTKLNEIDNYLLKKHLQTTANYLSTIVRFCFLHLAFISVHTYEITYWDTKESYTSTTENGYILSRIVMYYKFFTTILIYIFAKTLNRRYKFIHKLLFELLMSSKQVTIDPQNYERRFREELFCIKKLYGVMSHLTEDFNILFGWPIFFSTVSNILVCLVNLNYVFQFAFTNNDLNFNIFIITGMYIGAYAVRNLNSVPSHYYLIIIN